MLGKKNRVEMNASGSKTLLFVVSEDWYFASHRLDLAKMAIAQGWQVFVACRPSDSVSKIESAGVTVLPWEIPRGSLDPMLVGAAVWSLRCLVKKINPRQVHAISLFTVGVSRLALSGIRDTAFVGTIAGLGRLAVNDSRRNSSRLLLRFFSSWATNKPNRWITVQNVEDLNRFTRNGIVNSQVAMIPGSGVNPSDFPATPFRKKEYLQISMIARMIRSKGVIEFAQAIASLRSKGHQVVGILAGKPDLRNPETLTEAELTRLVHETGVEWIGHSDNPFHVIAESDIVCLPTYYGEGIPRVLLESGCVGRPVVSCLVPGPRDLIRHGVDGYLVPPKSIENLSSALERLVGDRKLLASMGESFHHRVINDFANEAVLNRYLELYIELQAS